MTLERWAARAAYCMRRTFRRHPPKGGAGNHKLMHCFWFIQATRASTCKRIDTARRIVQAGIARASRNTARRHRSHQQIHRHESLFIALAPRSSTCTFHSWRGHVLLRFRRRRGAVRMRIARQRRRRPGQGLGGRRIEQAGTAGAVRGQHQAARATEESDLASSRSRNVEHGRERQSPFSCCTCLQASQFNHVHAGAL